MHCSYRILKNVHIGCAVRKTSDKNTVRFDNEPFRDAKIVSYDTLGFVLSHSSFPKNIRLDFDQLPLCSLKITNGIIHDELTFVEKLVGRSGSSSMVLLKTETFDYLELLEDKEHKEATTKYKPSQLVPGDRVMSALCKDSIVMVYLGKFKIVEIGHPYYYYSYSERANYIKTTPDRLFFAIEEPNNKYTITAYPTTNKTVVELYKEGDKGNIAVNDKFTNTNINFDIIDHALHTSDDYGIYKYKNAELIQIKLDEFNAKNYGIELSKTCSSTLRGIPCVIPSTVDKLEVKKYAVTYINENLNTPYHGMVKIYATEQEATDHNSRRSRY